MPNSAVIAPSSIGTAFSQALQNYNNDHSTAWQYGTNWSSVGSGFETFLQKYLFPKITETTLVQQKIGNRFDFLADEVPFIGQFTEEYVLLDSVPVSMNLSKNAELMLRQNYPKMATKLYNSMIVNKRKFTINNNDQRQNFSTLGDATDFAIAVYKRAIDDINLYEETTIKSMIVDYALNQTNEKRVTGSIDETINELLEATINLQSNTHDYNETDKASGGAGHTFTTHTKLSDVFILTTDKIKVKILNSQIGNLFNAQGIDLTERIVSFPNLGGTFQVTEDVKLAEGDTITFLRNKGDYQSEIGDIIMAGTVFTFDISKLKEFDGKFKEIKPENENFAAVMDINKLRYKRDTKDMLKPAFYNGELDEVTYWLHYPSIKAVSPFYNGITIIGK